MKCSSEEAIVIYKEMVEEVDRAILLGAETKDQSTDDTLGSFEDTGPPVFLHSSLENANKLSTCKGLVRT